MNLWNYLAQETTINVYDLFYFIPFVAIFILYRIFMNKFILKPLSKHVAEKSREKFINRGFDAFHYIISSILGTLAFSQRPYFHCPFYFCDCREYIGYTGPEAICSIFEKIYYFYFSSYYISDALWVHTTKDIYMLIVHHILTFGMIITLALVSRPVVTLAIPILHDWVDVFLYWGKIFSYLQWKKLADIFLIIFGISFYYLRLFNCAAILYVGCTGDHPQPTHYWTYIISRSLFAFLYICHIIWGYQIFYAAKRLLSNNNEKIHDTRSDRDSDEQKKILKKKLN